MSIFKNKDYYPTPDHVISEMLYGVEVMDKVILEPSAGSGNILDAVASMALDTLAVESDSQLRAILSDKGYNLISDDFLKVQKQDISHVDLILMNPPFSQDAKHILHAFEIAPDGCEIVALCNWETLNNTYHMGRKRLYDTVISYGTYENIGEVFSNSDRKTNVEVGLIRMRKPNVNDSEFDYSMFFMEEEEENTVEGVAQYNKIRAIVSKYVYTLKEFDNLQSSLNNINRTNGGGLTINFGWKDKFTTKDIFVKELQRQSWDDVFREFEVTKHVTTNVKNEINKFIEGQHGVPFTMKNIFIMLDMIFQTRGENMQKSLVEAVDNFTMYTHKNRHNVEGWKTNKGHMLNHRFIVNGMIEQGFQGSLRMSFNYRQNYMEDLIKVLCVLSGEKFETIQTMHNLIDFRTQDRNTWYDLKTKSGEPIFLKYKYFYKGTIHFEFTDIGLWKRLNMTYAKIKGVTLPERAF